MSRTGAQYSIIRARKGGERGRGEGGRGKGVERGEGLRGRRGGGS